MASGNAERKHAKKFPQHAFDPVAGYCVAYPARYGNSCKLGAAPRLKREEQKMSAMQFFALAIDQIVVRVLTKAAVCRVALRSYG